MSTSVATARPESAWLPSPLEISVHTSYEYRTCTLSTTVHEMQIMGDDRQGKPACCRVYQRLAGEEQRSETPRETYTRMEECLSQMKDFLSRSVLGSGARGIR